MQRARDWQDRSELKRLCEWWRDFPVEQSPYSPVGSNLSGICALIGIGGAGKTAIAERFLCLLPGGLDDPAAGVRVDRSLAPIRGLFVFSFYETPSTDLFFSELQQWLEGPPLSHGEHISSDFALLRLLRRQAAASPAWGPPSRLLIVLDGMEKIQDDSIHVGILGRVLDERLSKFLKTLASGLIPGIRGILTTRFPITDLDDARSAGQASHYFPVCVEGITDDAGIALLRSCGVDEAHASDNELRKLIHDCGSHALTVELAGGLLGEELLRGVGRSSVARLLATWDLPSERELQHAIQDAPDPNRRAVLLQERRFARIALCYRESLSRQRPQALALLDRICLFKFGASPDTLASLFTGPGKEETGGAHLARLNHAELADLLRILRNRRLLPRLDRQAGTWTAAQNLILPHPVIRAGFLKFIKPDEVARARAAIVEHVLAQLHVTMEDLRQLPKFQLWLIAPTAGKEALDKLEEVLHQLLCLGRWEDAFMIYHHAMGGYASLANVATDFVRGLSLTKELLEFYDRRSPERCRVLNDAGGFSRQIGTLRAAKAYFRWARAVCRTLPDPRREEWWIARRNLVNLEMRRGYLPQAGRWAIDLLHDLVRCGLPSDNEIRIETEVVSWGTLAITLFGRGRTSGALKAFRRAKQWEGKLHQSAPRFVGFTDLWAALARIRKGASEDLEAAAAELRQIREEGEFNRSRLVSDWANLIEARIELARGNLASAERALKAFQDCTAGTGEHLASLRCTITEAAIAWARKRTSPELLSRLTMAIADARTSGYSLYHIDLLLERARQYMLQGRPWLALRDVRIAVDKGLPSQRTRGYPALLAAADKRCDYRWGVLRGHLIASEALLLRAAQKLGRAEYDPLHENSLPTGIRKLISLARGWLTSLAAVAGGLPSERTAAEVALGLLASGRLTGLPVRQCFRPPEDPNQVFISYSHLDRDWMEQVRSRLSRLGHDIGIAPWSDQNIPPNADWEQELEAVISRSKLAILLVSRHFLNSEFIMYREVPLLLEARRDSGLILHWFLLEKCEYRSTPLSQIESVADPEQPLADLTEKEREQLLSRICQHVRKALRAPAKSA
ncbi:MAG: toll/interleukin-1 receptor domain-containing protein [Verrucomicrobiia bacterium]